MGAFRDMLTATDGHCIELLSGPDVVRYHAGDGVAVSVSGIFDDGFQDVSLGLPGVQSSGPQFFCRVDSLSSDPRCDAGAWLEVNGVHYVIREYRPDGQGSALMMLHSEVCP